MSDTEGSGRGVLLSGENPGGGVEPTLTPEMIFDTLSNQRRRYTIHYLKGRNERTSIRELSRVVAAWENGVVPELVTPKQRKRVYTALHQTHLPKMARLGVVEYDIDRGDVVLTDRVSEFDIYLEILPRTDIAWPELYLALGAVSLALLVVRTVGVFPFSFLPDIAYATGITLLFLVAASFQYYDHRRRSLGGVGRPPELDLDD